MKSTDFNVFLSHGMDYLDNNCGIFGIGSIDSNYNLPYLYFGE